MPYRSLRRPARGAAALILSVLLFTLILAPALGRSAGAAAPDVDAANRALAWLRIQQQSDGSFSAFGGPGDPGTTADVVFAFASAGVDPHSVSVDSGTDAVTYLENSADGITSNPGLAAKVALALHAAGADPHNAAGTDLLGAVTDGYDSSTGWYGVSFYAHALALIALHAVGVPLEPGAVSAVAAAETPDGSWGYAGDPTAGTGDSNTTAVVIQALAELDGDQTLIEDGINYLLSLQDDGGAVAYDGSLVPLGGDSNSTALAIQAFIAAGRDPSTSPGGDLLAALAQFENPSGAYQFQPAYPDDSLLSTAQAVPALMLLPLPIPPVAIDNPLLDAAAPAPPIAGCDYHAATQHNVCGGFDVYWQSHGGLAVFGYALTEEFDDSGLRVQYFERARFEWHPENAGTSWEVLLTRLGADDVARDHAEMTGPAPAAGGCTYHDATAHNVCGPFDEIWNAQGALAIFGYPLTEQFEQDGVAVQYFERARFEWRPGGWPDHLDVFFGRIGAEAVDRELAR